MSGLSQTKYSFGKGSKKICGEGVAFKPPPPWAHVSCQLGFKVRHLKVVQVVGSVIAVGIVWAEDDRRVVEVIGVRPVGRGLRPATGEGDEDKEKEGREEVHFVWISKA